MEGNGTSATAMLVGTPEDVGGRPDAATVTLAREEIEEALASDEPLELILTVGQGASTPKDVRVAWQRSDLETVLAGTDAGGITFSFDRAELYRALEHPDFEGHGIREMVMLTVAAAGASAALAASTASGQLMEGQEAAVQPAAVRRRPGHGEATTASALPAAAAAIHDEATAARTRRRPGRFRAPTSATLAARGIDTQVAAIGTGDDEPPASWRRRPGDPRRGKRGRTRRRPGRSGRRRGIPRGTRHRHAVAAGRHGDATTASELASVTAIHDEATAAARGVGQTIPGTDEATLAARGIETPATHDEATLVGRGIETPAVVVDSGSAIEVPSLDSGTAAAIGGLAGAGLLIVGAAFVARRQRTTPA